MRARRALATWPTASLATILALSTVAMLSGARSLYAMAQWAQAALAGRRGEEQAIAIDGKALRGIHGEEVPGVLRPDRYLSDLEARWNQLAQAP